MDREEWKQEKKGKTRSKQANQEAKARLFNDKFLGENTISYTPHQFWRRGVFSIEHLFFHWKATWEPNETGGDKKEEAICHQLSLRLLMRDFQLKIDFSDAFLKRRVFTDFVTFCWLNGGERDAEAKATH